MTGKELKELVDNGVYPIIEFTEQIEELEYRFEKGMRAYVIDVKIVYENEVEITVDEKDFAEYNKFKEKPIWRDTWDGEYIHKYSELECHKNWKGIDTVGEMLNEQLTNCFVIIDDKRLKLFKQYQAEDSKTSYIEWLENKILK